MEINQSVLKMIGIIAISPIPIVGFYFIFNRLKEKEQGFGPITFKLLGLFILIPVIAIIVISTDLIKSEVLAALLGTIAGYVLSNGSSEKNN